MPVTDASYEAWLAQPYVIGPTPIASEDDLSSVLMPLGLSLTGPVSMVTGRQIMGQVEAAGVSGALVVFLGKTPKPDDVLYWYGVGLDTLVPSDSPKVGRILEGAGITDVLGFMTAALALVA